MSAGDTQWPRFQVFHQQRPDEPHINAGTVHAPDVELAFQNARDVFVRRPDCASLWVVPADAITSLTPQELERSGAPSSAGRDLERETYLIFEKKTQIGSHEYVGRVEAVSPEEALGEAVKGKDDVLVWWVAPERSVARTDDDDAASMFAPAREKLYRDPAFYHTRTLMRKLQERERR